MGLVFSACKCGLFSQANQPLTNGQHVEEMSSRADGPGLAVDRPGVGSPPTPGTLYQPGAQPTCSWCLGTPASNASRDFIILGIHVFPEIIKYRTSLSVDITHRDNHQEEVCSACYVPGALLRVLHLNSLSPQTTLREKVIIPVLQMEKLRHREGKGLA